MQAPGLSTGFGDFANTLTTPEAQAENPDQRKLYMSQSLISNVTIGNICGKKMKKHYEIAILLVTVLLASALSASAVA